MHFLNDIKKIISNILFVRYSIRRMIGINDGYDFRFLINDTKRKEISSTKHNVLDPNEENLNTSFKLLIEMLRKSTDESMFSNAIIMSFLKNIDNYIFGNSFAIPFILQLKPSIVFSNDVTKANMNHSETTNFFRFLDQIYEVISSFLRNIEIKLLGYRWTNYSKDCQTPLLLKENLLVKWVIEVKKGLYLRNLAAYKASNFGVQMPIYIINSDILSKKLSSIIDDIIMDKSKNIKFNLIGSIINRIFKTGTERSKLKNVSMPNEFFFGSTFDCYEINVDNKDYLIKKFNLEECFELPSGISTAFLNTNNNFESIGYMGVCAYDISLLHSYKNTYFFLSVEEKLNIYISTCNLDIFKNNHSQALYFLFDLLYILDKLCIYKIKLMSTNLSFSVDTKNFERWRFRVDHIGDFKYATITDSFLNFDFFIEIIDTLLCIISNVRTISFLRKLQLLAKNLKDSNIVHYTESLISEIEQYLIIYIWK